MKLTILLIYLLTATIFLGCNPLENASTTVQTDVTNVIDSANGTTSSEDGSVNVESYDQSVKVSWEAKEGVTQYNLYYAAEPIDDVQNASLFKDGQHKLNVSNPTWINNLVNQRFIYITVTAVMSNTELPIVKNLAAVPRGLQPSKNELLQVELINRARKGPNAEANGLGIALNDGLAQGTLDNKPKQPLALNSKLVSASRGHSQWMLDTNTFSHTGKDGSSPKARMEAAGYLFSGNWRSGENISWTGTTAPSIDLAESIRNQHNGLFKSSGHRKNLLNNDYKEIGVGQVQGDFTITAASTGQPISYNASMLTNKFARSNTDSFFTGVVLKTSDTLTMYRPDIAFAGVIIEANGYQYAPYTNGHFNIPLSRGSHTVTVMPKDKAWQRSQTVIINDENIKWDVYISEQDAVWVDYMSKP